ncbi:hypothetical protein VR010_10375 [Actinomycetaceae bacterium L2_0104]
MMTHWEEVTDASNQVEDGLESGVVYHRKTAEVMLNSLDNITNTRVRDAVTRAAEAENVAAGYMEEVFVNDDSSFQDEFDKSNEEVNASMEDLWNLCGGDGTEG